MLSLTGKALDLAEKAGHHLEDPEALHAGYADPHYSLSPQVATSQQDGLYVYHLRDDLLGHGASFGNASAWAETKGNGDMLSLFSVGAGKRVLGGMTASFLLPFNDLGITSGNDGVAQYMHTTSSGRGMIHLHPAYQQREFVIGDGLQVLSSFFLPRTGDDDPAVACVTHHLSNRTAHPIRIVVIASIDLRGDTPRDLHAEYDKSHHALVAFNESNPDWVRIFGADTKPDHHWATTDEEQAYSPRCELPDLTDETGDLTGALQFEINLAPHQSHKLRFIAGCSLNGRRDAVKHLKLGQEKDLLKKTIDHYRESLAVADVSMPDDLLTQGVQWAKACMMRPLANYPIGRTSTNDPGRSSNIVGRDTAWYTHGCDFIDPHVSCDMLRILADHQRDDGLIPEFVNALKGEPEFHGFNINDNTPLFIVAVAHHLKVTGHDPCWDALFEPARKAADLILDQRDDRGLVTCRADGLGGEGICGWRNVISNEQINGAVTEVNSECFGALEAMELLCNTRGDEDAARHYGQAADDLRNAINEYLINEKAGLYVRNIDTNGRIFTQATVDLVFPLVFNVCDEHYRQTVSARLSDPGFMTSGGIRVLPEQNPRWNPSDQAGCLGGVWPGATWWYAMGCTHTHPGITAEALRRSYEYLIRDPKTFNTVPGQFNEWCDGQTLVNRGMRLSPWAPPRYLWVAIEGLAGLRIERDSVHIKPRMPVDWQWLSLHNLPYHQGRLTFCVTRQQGETHIYTNTALEASHEIHQYDEVVSDELEVLTTGMTSAAFRSEHEILIFLGSSRERMMAGPLLAHRLLDSGNDYNVSRFNSLEDHWRDLGTISGKHLQRLAVRIEPKGFTLYRFIPQ